MKKPDFLVRFGMAVGAFSSRGDGLRSEIFAIEDAITAGLPRVMSLPHPQTTQSILTASKYPYLAEVEAERAWEALPLRMRMFG